MNDPGKTRLSSLSARAIVVSAAIFLALSWLLQIINLIQDRSVRIAEAQREVTNLSDLVREHTRINIRVVDQSLEGLATSLTLDRLTDPTFAANVHELLKRRRIATVGIIQFTVSSADGRLLHSSEILSPEPIDVSARPEFTRIRDGKPGEVFITPTIRGEFGAAKDKWIFVVSRRLELPDGTFVGAIHAAVSLDEFSALTKSLRLGPNSAVGMFHLDGTLMMREPIREKLIGQRFDNSPFMRAVRANTESGLVEEDVEPDNTFGNPPGVRYQAYNQVPGTPLVVYVQASAADLLAPWRRSVVNSVIAQGALTFLIGFLALFAFNTLNRRAAAEAAAEKARADMAQVFSATSDGIVIFDQQLHYTYINEAFCRIAAITREGVIGKTIYERLPNDSRVAKHLEECRTTGKAVTFQDVFMAGDGVERLIEVRCFPVDDNIACFVRNMSDARAAERLRADLQQAFANTSDGVIILDEQWRPTYINDAYTQIFEMKRDKVLGRVLWDIITGDNLKIARANFELCRSENRMVTHEESFESSRGQRWIEVRSFPLDRGMIAYIRDVSERRETEKMRADMAQVFASTSDGVSVFDENWTYVYVNDALCDIIGRTREELIGRKNWDISDQSRAPVVRENFEKCMTERVPVRFDYAFTTQQNIHRVIDVRVFPVDKGVTCFVQDVTQTREAERKLMESQRMDAVGRLTGGLAHDFNNMLAVVLGNIELLLARLSEPKQVRSAELIRSAATRGAEMVSRLLSFARRQPLDPKPTDVTAVVKDVQGLLRRTLPENIAFEFVGSAGLWQANADVAQLENVLVNLVINARDALPQGGKLTIEASNTHLDTSYAAQAEVPPGQYVMLAVSDTGTGMSPEVAAKAFEPFFTTKPVGQGTGLGLSMVYGFARQSGGHVRLYSELGQGTTVKLYLPRAHQQGAGNGATKSAETPQAPRGTETILMVEDEDMVREFVQMLLIDLGYNVIAHADAETALADVKAGLRPDLLLSDLILAGPMNGRRLAETLVKMMPDLRVLYMSGYTENAIVHQGRLDHGVHLITKPFRRYDIAVKIRALLDKQPTRPSSGQQQS